MTRRQTDIRRPAALLALGSLLLTPAGCDRTPPVAPRAATPVVVAGRAAQGVPKADTPECCKPKPADDAPTVAGAKAEPSTIPDVELLDQDGKKVKFASDLIRGRRFAVNFLFTTCRGVCPVLGANFAKLGRLLREQGERDVALVSVTVDPDTDGPARLKAWRGQFGEVPGWTLVTGDKPSVDRLLKALGAFAADKNQHTQAILVGDGRQLREVDGAFEAPIARVGGLAGPEQVLASLRRLPAAKPPAFPTAGPASPPGGRPPAEEYFTKWYVDGEDGREVKVYRDVTLTDQDGRERRFYGDLLKDRCVVIHAFFGSCTGACPKMLATMRRLQDRLGPRLGQDVVFVSLSVDPLADTPEKLKALAGGLSARPGWYFLTGDPGDVESLMRKLQPDFSGKASHATRLFIGNLRTNTWAKPDIVTFPEEKILDAAQRICDAQPVATVP